MEKNVIGSDANNEPKNSAAVALHRRTVFLAIFLALSNGQAEERASDSFETILEPIRLNHNIPALAAILMHGERIAGIGAVGYRKSGETVAVSREDRWHLGSIGKFMTATMIARLVERGVLSWNLNIGKSLGAVIPDMDSAYRNVTLEDLLAHRSGLVGGHDQPRYLGW